jgi:RNA polymerase sigma factor (sigma-70 family)
MEPNEGPLRVPGDDRGKRQVIREDVGVYVVSPVRFEDFYRLNRDRLVRALALTLRDATLATEAGDEAMARTYQRWSKLRSYRNPTGWAYRVGLNWAISNLRKRRREVAETTFEPPVWDPEPFDPVVAEAIGGLSDRYRAVVVLRYFMDWSDDEIADALDLRVGTVKSRLHRALGRLRDSLEEH